MKEMLEDLKITGNLVGVRFYRLTFNEARRQGWRTGFFWVAKKLLRLGTYGHVAIIIPALQGKYEGTEYTLTDKGLDVYPASSFSSYSNDVIWLKYDVSRVLHFIQEWGRINSKGTPVTIPTLAKALSRPNCYSTPGCCTHFVCYCLSIPPTTLADELCQTILLDMNHVPSVAVETMSEYGEQKEVLRRSTALAVERQWELDLIRNCLGLCVRCSILLSNGADLRKKLVSSMMSFLPGKS